MPFRFILSFFLVLVALPANAFDPTSIGTNVVAEWQKWMTKHNVPEGALIVAHNGTVVATGEVNRSVDAPAKVASLSKAITAICALKAADSVEKSAGTPLSEAIPKALAEHPPKDDTFPKITIGQLITHTSGIESDYHRVELAKLRTFEKENKLWQFSKVVQESLAPSGAAYRYSNANYLTLGLVIEELTAESYEEYCARTVLDPAGATTGKLNADWRVMSAWGGWEISARDYLKFAETHFAGDHSAERPAGFTLPSAFANDRTKYSAGLLFRRTRLGINAWHQGSWTGVRGRSKDRFGAYVALYDNGFSVVTNYAHDAWERDISRELDDLLYKTTHP